MTFNIRYGTANDGENHWGKRKEFLVDVIRNPAFDPREVERIRQQQLANIASELTQPGGIAARALPVVLYGAQHPYGKPGTGTGDLESVRSVTRDELVRFHQSWIRPDNATIIVTHYQRLLNYIVPDYVHVLAHGRIVKSGDKSLALELEAKGYDWLVEPQGALA